MKTVIIALAAAALVSACASTAPSQVAANEGSCSAMAQLHAADSKAANLSDARIVGDSSTSACQTRIASQGMTPAALHQRAQTSPTRRGATLH